MSGGSYNYLYNVDICDLFNRIDDLVSIGSTLSNIGYSDISSEVLNLITFIQFAENNLERLFKPLIPILKAVEYYDSSDINRRELIKILDSYKLAE